MNSPRPLPCTLLLSAVLLAPQLAHAAPDATAAAPSAEPAPDAATPDAGMAAADSTEPTAEPTTDPGSGEDAPTDEVASEPAPPEEPAAEPETSEPAVAAAAPTPAEPEVATADVAAPAPAPEAPAKDAEAKPKWYDNIKLSGFGVLWFTPTTDLDAPDQPRDSFSIRFARFAIDANMTKHFKIRLHTAMEFSMPFLDMKMTWRTLPYLNVTGGQFKIPLGASAMTPAPKLLMMDRPFYVRQMVKVAFRDVGVMVHTQKGGIANGVLEYYLGVYGGGGRTRVGPNRGVDEPGEYLYAGRVVLNPGALFLQDGKGRLALAGSYATTEDPPIDTGDAAQDKSVAGNTLGRHTAPIAVRRRTQVVGGDLTFAAYNVWAQGELLYLHSRAVDGSVTRSAVGGSGELGYTLKTKTQPAVRYEYFDKNLDQSNDENSIGGLGLNQDIGKHVRLSAFAQLYVYHDGGAPQQFSGGFTSRAMFKF